MTWKSARPAGWLLFGCIAAGSIALFYLGYYKYLLVSDSTSFSLENTRTVVRSHHDATVLVLGDSTAAHDFKTNYYNRNAGGDKAVNAGVPGTGLFSYHKLALFAKERAPRIKKVIVIVGPDLFKDREDNRMFSDIEYNKTSLSLRDIPLIWKYSSSPAAFTRSVVNTLFRPLLFGKDMRNLLLNPVARLRRVKGSYGWLNRPIGVTDPLWEDDRGFNACGIGDLDTVQESVRISMARNDIGETQRLQWIAQGYESRKAGREINPLFAAQLIGLVRDLAGHYEKIYLVNAPIYSGFEKAYSASYLRKIQAITAGIAGLIPSVEYVSPNSAFNDDCSNFMDVVHLNKFGAERYTDYLIQEMNRLDIKPLILVNYGPTEIRAGRDFNLQASNENAIWAAIENGTESTAIMLGRVELASVVQPGGKLITAVMPRKYIAKPGEYPLYLFDKKSKLKSNVLNFTVK